MVKQQFLATAFKLFSRRERWVFSILFFLGLFGLVGLASIFNAKALIEVPASGGSLSEGLIGSPRFINPLLATSDTDKDLSYLVYSGLMRITPNNELIPDLAENYEISSSGLEYTFTLKNNLVWQDGKPITADDVVFTIEQVKNQTIKSPRFPNWEGI
ncbi:MAG: ABC transporter substrate-binding protein, partial [Patescibacteria group bacterium]